MIQPLKRQIFAFYEWLPWKLPRPSRASYSGLVGCGRFARAAYLAALNTPGCPVVCSGLVSRSLASAKAFQRRLWYQAAVYPSWDEFCASGIRSVIIALPNHLHAEYVEKALEKGLDVLCEKPLVNSLGEAMRVRTILQKSGRILMTAFNRRFQESMRKIEDILKEGRVGTVREVRACHNQDIGNVLLESDWLCDQSKSGGGVLHHAGVHLLNVMLYLFGEVDRVSATFQNLKLPDLLGEDTAECEISFCSGVRGILKASYANAFPSGYERLEIEGDRGILYYHSHDDGLRIRSGAGAEEWIDCRTTATKESVLEMLKHFSKCVDKKLLPETDLEDSVRTLRVSEACKISAREKRVVLIREI
ncbi:MAG: Gfo/Idh/MocA family oxidoreductase [Candidatus Omnitrophica bacterium]|nr:Gfo/Idh/MocA family oxidoreductase [Candidatus Omnitrophota bacterium]